MRKIIKLTEYDLTRIVRRVLKETIMADENISSSELSYILKDNAKNKIYPVQSTSVTDKAVNVNLSKGYMFGKQESIELIIVNDSQIPLMINKVKILNGPNLKVEKPYEMGKKHPIFIPVTDIEDISNFTIVLTGNFMDGELTINVTSTGSTVKSESFNRRRY
jgi:hypothetical protein